MEIQFFSRPRHALPRSLGILVILWSDECFVKTFCYFLPKKLNFHFLKSLFSTIASTPDELIPLEMNKRIWCEFTHTHTHHTHHTTHTHHTYTYTYTHTPHTTPHIHIHIHTHTTHTRAHTHTNPFFWFLDELGDELQFRCGHSHREQCISSIHGQIDEIRLLSLSVNSSPVCMGL